MAHRYQPGARVSEYILEECVGSGTFGEVWQARHHIWEKERVAVKLPTEPEYVRFLQREGVVVHGVRHPNVVRVLGLDPYAETPYLVMELVRGPSLRDALKQSAGGLPIPVVLTVLRGILQAIQAAHEANIIHRDLKPGNVLLHLEGQPLSNLEVADVKVTDFGLGIGNADTLRSMVEQSASLERTDQNAALAGTLAYMAPELRDGHQLPGPRSDLYSIGVILFEILTGERPAGAELPSTLRADTPAGLDEVFRRLYARLENRYESAAAVLADLERRVPAGPGGLRTPPPPPAHPVDGGVHQSGGEPGATCPACHAGAELGDQFCTQCGHQLSDRVRRCSACGGFPGAQDRFCIFCGMALASSGE